MIKHTGRLTYAALPILLLFLVFIFITIIGARWFLAERIALDVEHILEFWDDNPAEKNAESWDSTTAQLEKALALSPNSPNIHLLKGKSYSLGYSQPWLVNDGHIDLKTYYEIRNMTTSTMVSSFRKAAELTPAFPYRWVDLANTKNNLAQIDEELFLAFSNAYHFGHSINTIQFLLARLSVENAYLFSSNPGIREIMVENFYQSLDSVQGIHNRVISEIRGENAEEFVCDLLIVEKLSGRALDMCGNP